MSLVNFNMLQMYIYFFLVCIVFNHYCVVGGIVTHVYEVYRHNANGFRCSWFGSLVSWLSLLKK